MTYNVKNVELVWRGLTLTGFGSQKVEINQSGTEMSSTNLVYGIFGESFTIPNNKRGWYITATFHPLSLSYPILEQDNLYNFEDTLIVRDLNNGTTDIFTNCTIYATEKKKDSDERTVTWVAAKRNGR